MCLNTTHTEFMSNQFIRLVEISWNWNLFWKDGIESLKRTKKVRVGWCFFSQKLKLYWEKYNEKKVGNKWNKIKGWRDQKFFLEHLIYIYIWISSNPNQYLHDISEMMTTSYQKQKLVVRKQVFFLFINDTQFQNQILKYQNFEN